MFRHARHHPINISQYIIVPKAQYLKPLSVKPSVSLKIDFDRFCVLPSVDLDD
jgi:hypothetical protein